jgi:hypothetical protein
VTAKGAIFKLAVNGKTIRTDSDMALPAGAIGLATSLTENHFRDIEVSLLSP